MSIVAEHDVLVPRNEAVADLVCLVPAMLQLGQRLIQKNPLAIRKIERLERRLANRVDEQHRPFVRLDPRNTDAADRLPHHAGVIGGVEHAIELQQLAHIEKCKRGLGVTQPPKHSFDTAVDVRGGLVSEEAILGQGVWLVRQDCSLSTATNASSAALSSEVSAAVGSDRAAKRTASSNSFVSFGPVRPATCKKPDRGTLK